MKRRVTVIFACGLLLGFLGLVWLGPGRLHKIAHLLHQRFQKQPTKIPLDLALTATVAVTIDAGTGRHPISPLIYGMAFAPDDYLTDLRLPLNRWGGNDKTRYNWVLGNADNAGRDWGFRNRFAFDASVPMKPSSSADRFVSENKRHSTATLLTVPTIGWVARDADNSHASVNVPVSTGPNTSYDPAANRLLTSVRSVARKGTPFTDSPTLALGVIYQDEWIAHLKKAFGDGAHGGVRFYAMDNEPDLWGTTHTDVHPAQIGYDDLLHNFLDYASAVKAVDPSALVTGPVSSGWTGYNYSALDRGDDNFYSAPDRGKHGGVPFLLWFLTQVQAHDTQTGRRTLDVLDVHFYPQGSGLYGELDDLDAQARRLHAARSLWDPTYTDESWIGEPVRLIPRLNAWIAAGYPGTRLGITEWNFGADTQWDGGVAVADVLGIYGRENVYLANYWAYPPRNSPGYLAFKLYRNPDGRGHGFGNIACTAASQNVDRLACYAAVDSRTGDLTVMLLNKMLKGTVTVPLTFRGVSPVGTVKIWRCAADNLKENNPKENNPKEISFFPSAPLPAALTLPPLSMTLLRLPIKR